MNPSVVRPSNGVRFEQLMYLSLGISVILVALQWNQLVAQFRDLGGAASAIFAFTVAFAIRILFILLFSSILAQSTPGQGQTMDYFGPISGNFSFLSWLVFVSLLAQIVAWFHIFTGNARGWFEPPA